LNGVCTDVSSSPVLPVSSEESFEMILNDSKDLINVIFDEQPLSFTRPNLIITTENNWVENIDYILSITEIGPDNFNVILDYLRTEYTEKINISTEDLQYQDINSGGTQLFEEQTLEFIVDKFPNPLLDWLNPATTKRISSASEYTTNNGAIISSFLPQVSVISVALSMVRIIPLLPSILPT